MDLEYKGTDVYFPRLVHCSYSERHILLLVADSEAQYAHWVVVLWRGIPLPFCLVFRG